MLPPAFPFLLMRRLLLPLLALALGVMVLPAFLRGGEGAYPEARVGFDPLGVFDGAAVPLLVTPGGPLQAAVGHARGETFPLAPLPDGTLLALAAIPLDYDQPVFPVELSLTPPEGAGDEQRIHVELPLGVRERIEQRLTLPPKMVEFPPEVAKRIDEESARVRRAILGRKGEFPRKGFIRPTAGRISGEFGNARVLNGEARSRHAGLDIAAPRGQAVNAANDGRVALAGTLYLTGKTVLMEHGAGIFTLYAHLDKIKVNQGDEVNRGVRIGTVGATGRATGPHLHYGAWVRGVRVDPVTLEALTPLLEPPSGAAETGTP